MTGCASTLERAQSAHQAKEYDEAQTLYQQAMGDEELRAAAEEGMATLLTDLAGLRQGSDPEGAEEHYRDALLVRPGNDGALTGLVRLLRSQERLEDASAAVDEAEASGQCGGSCGRLALVLLLERGDRAFAAKQWDDALAAYTAAQQVREQPAGAVAIAATHLEAGALAEAEAGLVAAQPLMASADASTLQRFLQVQQVLLTAVLAAGDIEAADRVRALRLRDEAPERPVELALQVANALFEAKDEAGALARYEALLQGADGLTPSAVRREEIVRKTARIYATQGTRDLHEGHADEADRKFTRAIELQPDDWALKLQRILALAGKTGAEPALASLSQIPANAAGLVHVRAILLSMRAREELGRGDVEAATASHAQAQQAYADLPEVHLAGAMLLAFSPTDELSAAGRRALLSKKSVVPYRTEVFRFGEALSELDRARQTMASRSRAYPFTAAWLPEAFADLEAKLAAVYPLKVTFREEPEPVVVFVNRGQAGVEVSVRGPEDLVEELFVAPGAEREVTVPDSGIVRLKIGRAKKVFYAEGYATVTIPVP